MRVGLISREYPPDTGWGGIGTFSYNLSHGLAELGHHVDVISLAGTQASQTPALMPGSIKGGVSLGQAAAVKVHRVYPHSFSSVDSLFNFCLPVTRPMLMETASLWAKVVEIHQEKPFDVIEAPEHFGEGFFAALARIAPLVLRLHTPHSKLLSEGFHNFAPTFDHRLIALIERLAMLSADLLISPSKDLATYVSNDLNYPFEDIAIVRNPVDTTKFCPEGPRAINLPGKVMVLFVGRLEQRKGIHHLALAIPEVLKQYPEVHFVVVGSDTNTGKNNGSMLAELNEMLSAHSAIDSVTFIKQIPLSDMPDYYRSADLCVVPSLYDNAPCTALEAMSCGRPVIATSSGGTAEYVIDGRCGIIIPPGDSKALSHAITSLLSNKQQRILMGMQARHHVLENFSCVQIAKHTHKLYELAMHNFSTTHAHKLYRKDVQGFVDDTKLLIDSFEDMIYNLLYAQSWRFRIRHWGRLFRENPRHFVSKLLVAPAKLFMRESTRSTN